MAKIFSRYGDGTPLELDEKELMEELHAGTEDAADRAKVSTLTDDDLKHLYEILASPYKFVSVEPGKEVLLTYDAGTLKIRRVGVNVDRIQALQIYEKIMGADTMELCHVDYSYKPLKPIVTMEQPILEQALLSTHIPLFYGAMPNLGLYSQPDGPFPNPAELLPNGKIKEARESLEQTVEEAVRDIVFAGSAMYESGADGINLDSVGAAGDADFLASLMATKKLKEKYPDICIEIGMAGEFILGMHGELEFEGTRLAGLYAHDQVRLAAQAGATIFGPVVNTNTTETSAWNLARAITFMKACGEVAEIPIHPNMGMGVGAVPVNDHPPIDSVSRASAAMTSLVRLDGL
ncbi:dimethylamine:corrinoid methyltransferase [Desulforhopalus singaporensis]|uniref:Dimethylamine:corrinoid methyltransferase n=1 Tax=Desulforhopalus singaporensis TaxID=91360 RepID=A0A1H0KDM8_9BACT|nr:dimethylamine:corrinoid methyltransferase [Desulforhopalus singaporensis]